MAEQLLTGHITPPKRPDKEYLEVLQAGVLKAESDLVEAQKKTAFSGDVRWVVRAEKGLHNARQRLANPARAAREDRTNKKKADLREAPPAAAAAPALPKPHKGMPTWEFVAGLIGIGILFFNVHVGLAFLAALTVAGWSRKLNSGPPPTSPEPEWASQNYRNQ